MSGHRDSTLAAVIGRQRFERPNHSPECWIQGGFRTHLVRGFRCPRCSFDREEDREEQVLMQLDRYARGTR